MADIIVLPPALASQIAAGEVVERPASALKELIENSIDANASRIDIEVEAGGIARLSVYDNGDGMNPANAQLCLERHATSKLRHIDELEVLRSLGFRGEALPSIASVSRFTLQTRDESSTGGTELSSSGGSPPSLTPVGMAVGTRIDVRDIFYNVPARRKFLRSSGTESGHITEVVEAAALSCPHISFSLQRDGRKTREWLRAPDRSERVRAAVSEELFRCAGEKGPLSIEAYVSRPERARSGAGGLKLFVNNRPVRARSLLHSVAQAYGSVLERGRYPRGVIYLDIPVELVDINVHPQKTEVRFADPRAVSDALYHLLSRELASVFSLPAPSASPWGNARAKQDAADSGTPYGAKARPESPSPEAPSPEAPSEGRGAAPGTPLQHSFATSQAPGSSPFAAPPPSGADPLIAPSEASESALIYVNDATRAPIAPSESTNWGSLRFIAQVKLTYLLCEGHDGLYIIDQHAAAERVNFHRLRTQYRSREVPAQALLFPVTIDLNQNESELVAELSQELLGLGIDVQSRGPGMASIHSVPKLLQSASPERLLRDLLTEVSRSGRRAFSAAVDLALATMACHGSIRAGDSVSVEEASALLAALDGADFAGHCPHGRPVVSATSWAELERRVGRR